MSLPLTKCYDPADFAELAEELKSVEQYWEAASEQSEMRKWEYALALRAQADWFDQLGDFIPANWRRTFDVGGAGSPFSKMASDDVYVIDPKEGASLQAHMNTDSRMAPQVYCLSVLEHLPPADLDQFLYHLACLTAPGGLLFLTFDYHPTDGPDTEHFHWMRERIFGPVSWQAIAATFVDVDADKPFRLLGEQDWAWHGPYQSWGYAAASVALVKRA